MNERSEVVAWLRGEIVGPSRPLAEPAVAHFSQGIFVDQTAARRGPLGWRPTPDSALQEVLYYDRESPHRKYGAGMLHPAEDAEAATAPDEAALQGTDSIGADIGLDEGPPGASDNENGSKNKDESTDDIPDEDGVARADSADDFDVTSPDIWRPSTTGISFCATFLSDGQLLVRAPQHRRFSWQENDGAPFPVNGRYEECVRQWNDEHGAARQAPLWRRHSAVSENAFVVVPASELVSGKVIRRNLVMPEGSPLSLRVEVFPRKVKGESNAWLITVVLRNSTPPSQILKRRESVLYQAFFEVETQGGRFQKYPESRRPFQQLDKDEQSLALLYREATTWAVGHGCAAGWDTEPEGIPATLYADPMPAVQLPSMTPDIEVNGTSLRLSMRELSELPESLASNGWESLDSLANGYADWINQRREEASGLSAHHATVATRHLDACETCLGRIRDGIHLLRSNQKILRAFRLANQAMLLQQIATKQLSRRPLEWNSAFKLVCPQGEHNSPWSIYSSSKEDSDRVGSWRAFQVAFLLMSLSGVTNSKSNDRAIVDLIWFPTGGGKTEAYLAVMAFYMFHERICMNDGGDAPRRDGTNVLMRYTLRMLTTQQFQRAASLICAMEYMRRNGAAHGIAELPGKRFSLGLWIGGDGSPNKIADAKREIGKFRQGECDGNPLVLTECPWCRAEIGRYDGPKPAGQKISTATWNDLRTRGIAEIPNEGPLLLCTDSMCAFGQESFEEWLPVEVIDERLYRRPPSLVISTADKLAMVAYRPAASALFGRRVSGGEAQQESMPPGLIVQDELHLISGPLGTMYALYEAVFERLCSFEQNGGFVKPKLIASTATIRGAEDQVKALYARSDTQLFPSPGLLMGDSFFGKYARDASGKLRDGRLYLGIHAGDYGSVLTTQVRAFSSALFRPWAFAQERRDPWWTLLAFYNSIRELGGAKTLFDSDIRSRLKFMFNREGYGPDDRRNIRIVEELTSRLSQAEIVRMMDRLSIPCITANSGDTLDACLASSIIEVGVDIDRLSLMGVVGQPKTTATYIQVTGRVGRRWWERPGLILTVYNPSKSRDRSHFEQFHSYHRRLYERVEPTTATPFAISAIQRGLPGALIAWARQHSDADVHSFEGYAKAVESGYRLLKERCEAVQVEEDLQRSLTELARVRDDLIRKWKQHPQAWEDFPQRIDGEYLMLWPGQYATGLQKMRGVVVPSSMRQVDRSAELNITQGYAEVLLPEVIGGGTVIDVE